MVLTDEWVLTGTYAVHGIVDLFGQNMWKHPIWSYFQLLQNINCYETSVKKNFKNMILPAASERMTKIILWSFLYIYFPLHPAPPLPPSSHLWIWSPNNRIYWWLHFTDTPDPLLALEQQNRAPSLFSKSFTQATVNRREDYFKCRLLKHEVMLNSWYSTVEAC
jgi:hypothetical protein